MLFLHCSTSLSWLINEEHRNLKFSPLDSNHFKKVLNVFHKHIGFHKGFPSAADKKSLHMLIGGSYMQLYMCTYTYDRGYYFVVCSRA